MELKLQRAKRHSVTTTTREVREKASKTYLFVKFDIFYLLRELREKVTRVYEIKKTDNQNDERQKIDREISAGIDKFRANNVLLTIQTSFTLQHIYG